MRSVLLAGLLALPFLISGPARAEGHRVSGNVELRAPVWSGVTASAASNWRGLEMAGALRVSNVLGPIGLAVSGEHTFHQAGIFKPENKLKVGLELPITRATTAFAYWDRRFNEDVDRVFVGVRWGFCGRI